MKGYSNTIFNGLQAVGCDLCFTYALINPTTILHNKLNRHAQRIIYPVPHLNCYTTWPLLYKCKNVYTLFVYITIGLSAIYTSELKIPWNAMLSWILTLGFMPNYSILIVTILMTWQSNFKHFENEIAKTMCVTNITYWYRIWYESKVMQIVHCTVIQDEADFRWQPGGFTCGGGR